MSMAANGVPGITRSPGPSFCRLAISAVLALLFTALLPIASSTASEDEDGPQEEAAEESVGVTIQTRKKLKLSKWYLNQGIVNAHPRLDDAARLIDRDINQAFRDIAPGFQDVDTFQDQRDDFMIISPFIGVGRILAKRWDVFVQAGYSEGKVKNSATDQSIFFSLPIESTVDFRRSSFFAGIGVDYYPLGMVQFEEYESVLDRLKHTRPYVASTLNFNYLTFDAKVRATAPIFGTFVDTRVSERWRLWSIGASAGFDIPITGRSTFSSNVTYSFFFEHEEDFNGLSFNLYWKRFF